MWPSTKDSSTMTLLLHIVSPAFGKLVLQQLLLGPGQITKIYEKQKNLLHLPPCYWLEHVGFFRKSAKSSQILKSFLQQNSWPIWREERDLCQAQNWENITSWRNRSTNSRKFKTSELRRCPLHPYFLRISCSHYSKLCFSFGLGYIKSLFY